MQIFSFTLTILLTAYLEETLGKIWGLLQKFTSDGGKAGISGKLKMENGKLL